VTATPRRRGPWLAALGTIACLAALLTQAPPAAAASLTGVTWSTSKSTTGATGTRYTYTFTTATSSSLSSVTMSVPSGTGGSPTVGSVSPAALARGTISLAGSVAERFRHGFGASGRSFPSASSAGVHAVSGRRVTAANHSPTQ